MGAHLRRGRVARGAHRGVAGEGALTSIQRSGRVVLLSTLVRAHATFLPAQRHGTSAEHALSNCETNLGNYGSLWNILPRGGTGGDTHLSLIHI